jgi:processive 1,2-diacylglycerol beta-glucosyltransferase
MPQRFLVLSASVGAGHLRAAQAVELALRELYPDALVQNVDVLQLTNALFRRLYGQAYLDLVNRAPHVLGYFYDMLDRPTSGRSKRDRLRLAVEKLNLTRFQKLLTSEQWDVVVNTHFLPAEIIAHLKSAGRLHAPHMTATTDFETHRLWVNQPCDHYTTATDEGAANLVHWGVPAGQITVTGIPIHPVFARPVERRECLRAQDLAEDRPVVLQAAGGFGVGPVAGIFQRLLELPMPLQIVVVAGRNAAAQQHLATLPVPPRHRVKIMGFTDQMDQLLGAADVVVSKPGGLTTSEVLARGAVMAIVNPIPGQESRNSDFLLENGAAIKINSLNTLTHKLGALLADAPRLARLKAAARALGRPRAAYDVAALAGRLAR